jgi:hypothetical protein
VVHVEGSWRLELRLTAPNARVGTWLTARRAHPVADEPVGVYAKIARAEEHIEALRVEMRSYFKGPPPAINGEIEFNLNTSRRDTSRLRYRDIPIRVPILVGDAAVALRCSLDHLAWQLVLKNGGQPTSNTYFPSSEKGPTPNRWGHQSPPYIDGGVSNQAMQIIEAVQPYTMAFWKEHPLLLIDRLAKIDKHRTLIPGHGETGDFTFGHPGTSRIITFSVSVGDVHDDYAELSFITDPADIQAEVSAYVFVSDGKGQEVLPIEFLTDAAQFVRDQVVGPIERACF